jgi:hypothetical protein
MNRLNTDVTVSAAPEEFSVDAGPPPSAYPLYVDNLIYLPFARHLADGEVGEEEEETAKAA